MPWLWCAAKFCNFVVSRSAASWSEATNPYVPYSKLCFLWQLYSCLAIKAVCCEDFRKSTRRGHYGAYTRQIVKFDKTLTCCRRGLHAKRCLFCVFQIDILSFRKLLYCTKSQLNSLHLFPVLPGPSSRFLLAIRRQTLKNYLCAWLALRQGYSGHHTPWRTVTNIDLMGGMYGKHW